MTPSPSKKNNSRKKKPEYTDFPGFADRYDFQNGATAAFIIYPQILERYWADLTGAEQKCLDYIIRRTFGWHKTWDNIGLEQFQNGVGGTSKDRGTGLSRSSVRRALKGLEQKGFIAIERRKNWVHLIRLKMKECDADSITLDHEAFDAFKKMVGEDSRYQND